MSEYIFKTQTDGTIIGGYPIKKLFENEKDVGLSRFDNLVIPCGLFKSINNKKGGSTLQCKEYIQEGGEPETFEKLFGQIATTKYPSKRKTLKNTKLFNVSKRKNT